MIRTIILIHISIFSFLGCDNSRQRQIIEYTEVSGKLVDSLVLNTDSVFQITNINGFTRSLYSQNILENTFTAVSGRNIYELNLDQKELSFVRNIPSEGPSKISSMHQYDGIVKVNIDQYVYAAHWTNFIHVVEQDSIFKLAHLLEGEDRMYNIICFSLLAQPYPIENKVIVPVAPPGFEIPVTQLNSAIVVDLLTNDVEEIFYYPADIFGDVFWSHLPYLYAPSIVFNQEREEYTVSYPVAHSVLVFDKTFQSIGEFELSSKYGDGLQPYTNSNEVPPIDKEKMREHFRRMSFYCGVAAAPGIEKIFRFFQHSSDDGSGGVTHRHTLIVADNSYNYLGEWMIPKKYDVYKSFVADDGIYLFNQDNSTDDELVFHKYQF